MIYEKTLQYNILVLKHPQLRLEAFQQVELSQRREGRYNIHILINRINN